MQTPSSSTRYYHSGVNSYALMQLLAREGSAGMVNIMSATQPRMVEALVEHPTVPVALDSGAFQGETNPERYIQRLDTLDRALHDASGGRTSLSERFDFIAGLDVIGDARTTRFNWHVTRLHGIEPEPLWTYQVAAGTPEETITEMVEEHELTHIGIGGLVPVFRRDAIAALGMVQDIGRVLDCLGVSAHFFGAGNHAVLSRFADAPWFASADSQKWLAGKKGRRLYLSTGDYVCARKTGLRLTPTECTRQNVRQIDTWCGASDSTLLTAGGDSMPSLPHLTAYTE